jgi:hypothetical protein
VSGDHELRLVENSTVFDRVESAVNWKAKVPVPVSAEDIKTGKIPWHRLAADAVLRGVGAPTPKSAALFPESLHPFELRRMAVVLPGAGAALPSEQLAEP